jgi:uncharacterized protein
MKLLLLLLVVVIVGVVLATRSRRADRVDRQVPPPSPSQPPKVQAPAAMMACAHCGVHVLQADMQADATGRLFCSDAHRLAGPR